jgi:hypothetical protein
MQKDTITYFTVIAVLIAILGTLRMLRPQMDERLYAHFRNFSQIIEADSLLNGQPMPAPMQRAALAFNRKNYTRALIHLDTAMQLTASQSRAQLIAGLCHLELEHFQQAEDLLGKSGGRAVPPPDDVTWFMALTQLRWHNRRACKNLLKVVRPESPYRLKADTLAAKLE